MKTTEVKKLLREEKSRIQLQMSELAQDDPFNNPDHVVDNAAVDTDVREQETHQRIEAEINTLKERSEKIDIALERIEKGQYGHCKRCNVSIPQKRLDLIPETVYCVSCESHLSG